MSTSMTAEEQILWDYVDEESNDLILSMSRNVIEDGFDQVPQGAEMVSLKIMSAAIVKMLAIATEKSGRLDLATAYMEMVPLHVELIKVYTFRALEREMKR